MNVMNVMNAMIYSSDVEMRFRAAIQGRRPEAEAIPRAGVNPT